MPSISQLTKMSVLGKDSKETIQMLTDAYIRLRNDLEFFLQCLDEENVVRAQQANIADLLAGTITADQIDVTNGKIQAAQIEDLTVGGNVQMGPDAYISWDQIDGDKPPINADNTWQTIGADRLTYIDSNGIYTGTLTAQQINVIQGIELGENASIHWGELPNLPTAAQIGARPSDWMPSAADVGARPASWMPTAYDVGALPWDTYIPEIPSYIKSTYIDQTNVISPFISGGVITGALFKTAPEGQRLEFDVNGITSYSDWDTKMGIAINYGAYAYSSLDFYFNDTLVGSLEYNGIDAISLAPRDAYTSLRLHDVVGAGAWDLSECTSLTGVDQIKAVFG